MGKNEFEEKCKKEGHKPVLKMINFGVAKSVNVKEKEFEFKCSICDATCKAKGQWNNPIN